MGSVPVKPIDKFQTMAVEVHRLLTSPSPTNRSKLTNLVNRLSGEEVRKLEINYPHQCGATMNERIDSALLRTNSKKYWAPYPADLKNLLALLDRKNPMVTSSISGGLTSAQRSHAIALGASLQHKWPRIWVPGDVLAGWLFSDAVWKSLCNAGLGGGVPYVKHTIGGAITVWLFRTPGSSEIAQWDSSGAEAYLREIASRIDKQLTYFSEDIGWFLGGRGTVMAGEGVIAGLKSIVRSYQKCWEDLGNRTRTLDIIKHKLLLPKSTFMKYLWSESERRSIPLWRESKSG